MRAAVAFEPPGKKGLMIRSERSGQACAQAPVAKAGVASKDPRTVQRRL